jgi:hypothetical protein
MPKRELIIIACYINVEGLSRKIEEEEMYKLINKYRPEGLPDDINENYYIDYMWIPIKKGVSRIELVYPSKFKMNEIALEDVDLFIDELKKYKEKNGRNQKD